ncbi:TPA: hypothetical protein ACPONG_001949, partial [Haemophilus influenzae]
MKCLYFHQKIIFLNIFTKSTCKGFENPYNAPHTTTHCCEVFLSFQVRRYFLLFNNISDNLCGHLLI